MVGVDRIEGRVLRLQADPSVGLAEEGLHRRLVGRLVLAGERNDDVAVPRIVAPLLAEENVEDVVAVPESIGQGADFLLTIHGDSMIDAGILDGDTIVVQRRDDARNGDIVVALAGEDETADEATVKTFYREAGRIRLQPENDALEPIYANHVEILGRVTGVFRSL